MVRLGELMMILELHRQGVSITAIARRAGRDPKTIRKYIERGIEAPVYGPRSVGRPSKLAAYLEFLRERVTAFPDLSAARLTREIRELGYIGAYTAVTFRETSVPFDSLVRFDNNKYSVNASAIGRPVEIHAYADRIVIRQDGRMIGEHRRSYSRGETVYDPWHYVPVLARKPGALRNGAPFRDWVLPAALERVRRRLAGSDDGDRQMVAILTAVLTDGLPAVEAACAHAMSEGVHSSEVTPRAGDERRGDARPDAGLRRVSVRFHPRAGSVYTATETLEFVAAIGHVACFIPVRSPESNGVSEATSKPSNVSTPGSRPNPTR